jgi:hypothetical protein
MGVGLTMHPAKSKIVYCQDSNRTGTYAPAIRCVCRSVDAMRYATRNPDKDALSLRNMGVAEIFGPGTTVHEIVARLVRLVETSRFGVSAWSRCVTDLDRKSSTVDSGPRAR